MTNPESRSIELDELAVSDDADTVDANDNQVSDEDIRELTAYGLESNDRTWVGIGSSRPASPAELDDLDRDARTLVGMGPIERAERASRARQAQEPVESLGMPQSEPPGPFVAADELPSGPAMPLPMHKGASWALLLPAALVAAAGVIVVRGLMPHPAAPPAHAAALELPPTNTEAVAATRAVALSGAAAESTPVETTVAEITAAETPAVLTETTPAVAADPAPTREVTGAAPKRQSTKPVDVAASADKRSERADAALGSLDIMSSPAAGVVLDGRPLGKAPRLVKIAPGLHTVVFIHPERGRMLLNVNVTAGQTTSASADF